MATIIYTDGASKSNPGQASAAAVIVTDGVVVATYALRLGVQTNNVAEYQGLILGLYAAREHGLAKPSIRMDSKLVVEQFNGAWKCKDATLKGLLAKAESFAKASFAKVDLDWIPRERNSLADQAGNDVLDGTIDEKMPIDYFVQVETAAAAAPAPEPKPETYTLTRAQLLQLVSRVSPLRPSSTEKLLDAFLADPDGDN